MFLFVIYILIIFWFTFALISLFFQFYLKSRITKYNNFYFIELENSSIHLLGPVQGRGGLQPQPETGPEAAPGPESHMISGWWKYF